MYIFYGHYIFFVPRINKSLNEFNQSWNNHPIHTTGHKSPNQLFSAGAILLQNSQIAGLDFFHEVDEYYGVDHDPNGPTLDMPPFIIVILPTGLIRN